MALLEIDREWRRYRLLLGLEMALQQLAVADPQRHECCMVRVKYSMWSGSHCRSNPRVDGQAVDGVPAPSAAACSLLSHANRVSTFSMGKQASVLTKKRRGPPPTGKGQMVGVRLQPDLMKLLDDYRSALSPVINRAAAIRRIVIERLQRKRKK
jgi:hypothetical protein